MTQIIVIGHGSYPDGVRSNLEMVVGVPENMHFVNFSMGMERAELEQLVSDFVTSVQDDDILFCADLPGATPFQISALKTAENPEHYCTVVGLNNMAYMEMAMDSDESAAVLAARALETTKESVAIFPQ